VPLGGLGPSNGLHRDLNFVALQVSISGSRMPQNFLGGASPENQTGQR